MAGDRGRMPEQALRDERTRTHASYPPFEHPVVSAQATSPAGGPMRFPVLMLALSACTPKPELAFPEDFLWGTATAGFQVDMGCPTWSDDVCVDTASDWYQWVNDDDVIGDRDLFTTGDDVRLGPGMWELFEQDVDQLEKDHHGVYRMSVEWSRLFPDAAAADAQSVDDLVPLANPAAVARYHEMFDALHNAGIVPVVTVNHYTLPLLACDRRKACLYLGGNNGLGLTSLTLFQGFTNTNHGLEPGSENATDFFGHCSVCLSEELATFGMTDQGVLTALIQRHVRGNLTGVGSGRPLRHVLNTDRQHIACAGNHVRDVNSGRNDNNLNAIIKRGRLGSHIAYQRLCQVFRPVHFPVSGYNLPTHNSSRTLGRANYTALPPGRQPPENTKLSGGFLHNFCQFLDYPKNLAGVLPLRHHTDQRLCARGPQQNPAGTAQLGFGLAHRSYDIITTERIETLRHPNVDHFLGELAHPLPQIRKGFPGLPH